MFTLRLVALLAENFIIIMEKKVMRKTSNEVMHEVYLGLKVLLQKPKRKILYKNFLIFTTNPSL